MISASLTNYGYIAPMNAKRPRKAATLVLKLPASLCGPKHPIMHVGHDSENRGASQFQCLACHERRESIPEREFPMRYNVSAPHIRAYIL